MDGPEFTVVATSLKVRHWWKLPRFFALTNGVRRALSDFPGLVGYQLKADFLKLRFSTVSIWESDYAINEFLKTGAHLAAVQGFPAVGNPQLSTFVRWKTADPLEATWPEAFDHLRSSGVSLS